MLISLNYDLCQTKQSNQSNIYIIIQSHWLNAHGISNPVDILSWNDCRHVAIYLTITLKNVSLLVINRRKSDLANISIGWPFVLLTYKRNKAPFGVVTISENMKYARLRKNWPLWTTLPLSSLFFSTQDFWKKVGKRWFRRYENSLRLFQVPALLLSSWVTLVTSLSCSGPQLSLYKGYP